MIDNNFALFSLNFLSDIYASFFFFFKRRANMATLSLLIYRVSTEIPTLVYSLSVL